MEGLTEAEQVICDYILQHPEQVGIMSSRELGEATFTSAASVTRFSRKLGCKGYPDFKLRFVGELRLWDEEKENEIRINEKESVVSLVKKISDLERNAVEETRKALSLEQMIRVRKLIHQAECVDFYVYDTNVHLAKYACSQLLHAGKMAYTHVATNVQQLHALLPKENHVAIVISHTGKSTRLLEIVKALHKNKTKVIVISAYGNQPVSKQGDEFLYAACPKEEDVDQFWHALFFSSAKYLLDIIVSMEFSANYENSMNLNKRYEQIGREKLWSLSDET